jgi:hypothetical protein
MKNELDDKEPENNAENSAMENCSPPMAVEILLDEEDMRAVFAGRSGRDIIRVPSFVSSSRSCLMDKGEDGLGGKLSLGGEEDIVEHTKVIFRNNMFSKKWVSNDKLYESQAVSCRISHASLPRCV